MDVRRLLFPLREISRAEPPSEHKAHGSTGYHHVREGAMFDTSGRCR